MLLINWHTVYPKKYAHGSCFAVLCCGNTLTDFPISTRLTSLALWQSNDCPSASKATLMNMDKYFIWIHYERLHNHNKAKHNKTVCIFLGIYCTNRPLVPHICVSKLVQRLSVNVRRKAITWTDVNLLSFEPLKNLEILIVILISLWTKNTIENVVCKSVGHFVQRGRWDY